MKTTMKISPPEWEALSAYLDGQLGSKERLDIERRLETSPDLQAALEGLRRTRLVLRSQPRLRAPRNFTLTPEMAGLRTMTRSLPRWYPTLRLASVLATLFFLLIFVGDLFFGPRQPVAISINQAAPNEEAAPRGFPAGMGGGGGGGVDMGMAPPSADASAEVTVVVEAPVALTAQETLTDVQGAMAEAAPSDGPAQPSAKMWPESTPAATEAALAVEPLPTQEEFYEPQEPGVAEKDAAAQAERGTGLQIPYSFLRVVQVLLAILAVGSGAAAFYLRRRSIGD